MNTNTKLSVTDINNHMVELENSSSPIPHEDLLDKLVEHFQTVDFLAKAFKGVDGIRNQITELKKLIFAETDKSKTEKLQEQLKELEKKIQQFTLTQKHLYILAVEEILSVAKAHRWGLCKHNEAIYIYNGCFWQIIEDAAFLKFLGKALLNMGVTEFTAKDHKFWDLVYNQFLAVSYLPAPKQKLGIVLINYKNGTLEISTNGTHFRNFSAKDFLKYQLPYEYNPDASAPKFINFLNRVLPDPNAQAVLSEYLGYIFIPHTTLNLEKTMMLYGSGANGKSVIFNIVTGLLGNENVSSYSLQNLTNETGYSRARLGDALCNYASEISGSMQTAIFKQLVSGEPVEARLPYGKPFILRNYAKLIFNTNVLPKDVEHTKAYFRRFLILPFNVTIPEAEQDPKLAQNIIESELPGILNWVLEGLNRLLLRGGFSECELAADEIKKYETESDSVNQFLIDNNLQIHNASFLFLKDVYRVYRSYCLEDGFKPLNKTNFHKRLKFLGIQSERIALGNIVYLSGILSA
jgi:putative DNA primase/helicase